jgi:hypothetical protein
VHMKLCLAAATACLLALPAAAAPVSYELVLTVDRVDTFSTCIETLPGGSTLGATTFGCIDVGDTFSGRFSVDGSILAVDGPNNTAPLGEFYLPFGFAVYSTGSDNLTLAGFRNPALGAAAPGFTISGGEVTDLFGGVYGLADIPFIDFSGFLPSNRFSAYDGTTGAQGTLSVYRVPEPGSLGLAAASLAGLAFVLRRRRQDGSRARG